MDQQVEPVAEDFEDNPVVRDERIAVAKGTIIGGLQREAEDRVGKKQLIEQRWLDDLRQLHGEYDDKIKGELRKTEGSKLFINQTRPKTNTCAARLSDMLFPTDDKNWGLGPTPVPDLATNQQVTQANMAATAQRANEVMAQHGKEAADQVVQAANDQSATVLQQLKARMDEAKQKAASMQDEIEDQLRECNYALECRRVIKDAAELGTGIMKGPVGSMEHSRRSWQKRANGPGYELVMRDDQRPAFYWVDPWSWFPETDARNPQESSSSFERHLMTEKQLRDLAKHPGFDKDAIRRLIKAGEAVTSVVRTSATVVTITLSAFATYDITATETITVTVPSTAVTGGVAIVATPTFTVSPVITSVPNSLMMMGMGS